MKALLIILALTFSTAFCFGQSEYNTLPPTTQPESVMKLQNAPNPYPHQYNDKFDDMCLKYKAVRNGGIVMMVLGGGLVVTGAVLLNKGDVGNRVQDENGNYHTDSKLQTGGKAAIALGAISMAAGIPLVAIGATKMKTACGFEPPKKNKSYLQLNSDDTGLGMSVTF